MKSNIKFFNNDEGVSPIIATLVLIVVAIIGAAAVGLIMSNFSSSVSQQANSGNTAGQASTTISVAGSTSMQPVITQIAAWYGSNNTGVKVNVAPGGSGVGYMSVEKNMADIGMISEGINSAQLTAYPNLKAYQVGASGVAFAYATSSVGVTNPTPAQLATLFSNTGLPVAGLTASVGRSDVSGTQDTAKAFLQSVTPGSTWAPTKLANGNGGVYTEITTNVNEIGILDSDYAFGKTGLTLVDFSGTLGIPAATPPSWANIQKEIQQNPSTPTYPAGLVRPLNLITNGPASSMSLGFIQYCQAPTTVNQNVFAAADQVHISQVASAFLE